MAFLHVSSRGAAESAPDTGREPAFAFVGRNADAASVRAALPFDDVGFERKAIANCTFHDLCDLNCELSLSASDSLRHNEHWSGTGLFGNSADALRLMGLRRVAPGDGDGVNVIIVDHGISRDYLRQIGHEQNYAGGWVSHSLDQPDPGQYHNPYAPQPDWHGNMIARNVLRIAPRARIYDAPLLPQRIDDLSTYTVHAELVFDAVRQMIRDNPVAKGPWVIVNAWAVADSASEHGSESYTNNPHHRLIRLVREMAEDDGIAFVFAAGNNGQFGGDARNGTYDTGPGNSILGVNGLPAVLTVGAVRTDGLWIGSSSQGPGPDRLASKGTRINQKPDVCAPSWFDEVTSPEIANTGTSAACALAAGLVAARLSRNQDLKPGQVFAGIRSDAARHSSATDWSPRYGYGPIHA